MIRRINEWIQKPIPDPGREFDIIGNALFRLNKALLVWVATPLLLFILGHWAVDTWM